MSKFDEFDNGPPLRPTMGKRTRASDRVASGTPVIARLVRHGHGQRGPGRARRAHVPAAAPGFAPKASARRVVIKAHVQHLSRNGASAATRHLRYIERDGVEKDGSAGVLYGPDGRVARETFEEPRLGERHQFRFIVSPEDGHDLDLTAYCRSLMSRVERDLGRRVEWAAVNHHDTDHPHVHVVVRGIDRDGAQLFVEPAYIARGMRWTAQALATDWLGPRLDSEIQQTYEREVAQERLTSLDRELARLAQGRRVDVQSYEPRPASPPPETLAQRLEQLRRLGLAERGEGGTWELADKWQHALRELGFRGDRLKQIHRALHGADPTRVHVVGAGQGIPDGRGGVAEGPMVGRLARKGLADESKGTYYAVIETPAGAVYHVPLPARAVDELQPGMLVTFSTTRREPTRGPVGRNRASGASEPIDRDPRRAPRYQLAIEPMALSLEQQVGRRGPVWLDDVDARVLHGHGLGAEVLAAMSRRREVLRELGIAPDDPERVTKLRELEKRAVGEEIARAVGEAFIAHAPERFRGHVRGLVGEATSSLVAVSDGRSFVLLDATAETRPLMGREVELRRTEDGHIELRDQRARRELGGAIARTTQMTFLPEIPNRFGGTVQQGPSGASELIVSDGVRFVLVPDSADAGALLGKRVEIAADRDGLFLGLRPHERHHGPSR